MVTFNRTAIYSFKGPRPVKHEVKLSREHICKYKLITDHVYLETTQIPYIFLAPISILNDFRDNSPHGFVGTAKDGNYYLDGKKVIITGVEQVYNGAGFIFVDWI